MSDEKRFKKFKKGFRSSKRDLVESRVEGEFTFTYDNKNRILLENYQDYHGSVQIIHSYEDKQEGDTLITEEAVIENYTEYRPIGKINIYKIIQKVDIHTQELQFLEVNYITTKHVEKTAVINGQNYCVESNY